MAKIKENEYHNHTAQLTRTFLFYPQPDYVTQSCNICCIYFVCVLCITLSYVDTAQLIENESHNHTGQFTRKCVLPTTKLHHTAL